MKSHKFYCSALLLLHHCTGLVISHFTEFRQCYCYAWGCTIDRMFNFLLSVWQRCRSLCCGWHGCTSDPRQYVEVIDVQQSIEFSRWYEQWLAGTSASGCQADMPRRTSGRRKWPSSSARILAVVSAAVWLLHCTACSLSAFSLQIELYACAVVWCVCQCRVTITLKKLERLPEG